MKYISKGLIFYTIAFIDHKKAIMINAIFVDMSVQSLNISKSLLMHYIIVLQALWHVDSLGLVPLFNHLLHACPLFGKAFLNRSVCMFDV